MQHIGLFEGIGGFSIATNRKGYTTAAWCEWDAECQKILSYYHPDADKYGDIRQGDFTKYRGKTHLLTGGFPCQPFSAAGKRKGTEDDRYLWPEMLRVIDEVRPAWVIGENVYGLVSWDNGTVLDKVCDDLKAVGYEVCPVVIPASGVGAPHRRDRIWFIARNITDTHELTFPEPTYDRFDAWANFPTQWPVVNEGDGQVGPLDGLSFPKWRKLSIKGYGNAICPQVAEIIIDVIHEFESLDYATIPEMLMARDVWTNDRCSLEWRLKKSKSGRPFYMLQTSKSKLIPTPTVMDQTGATANMKSTQVKEGSMHSVTLARAANTGLLPTPISGDWKGQKRADGTANMLSGKATMGLLPTPRVKGHGNSNSRIEAGKIDDLTTMARFGLLPTPRVFDVSMSHPLTNGENKSLTTGLRFGITLPQLAHAGLLPTPTVQDADKATKKMRDDFQNNLTAVVFNEMLPTPAASDYIGGGNRKEERRQDDKLSNAMHARHGEKGKTTHLNPAFVAEMMGFPVDYTYLPFAEL